MGKLSLKDKLKSVIDKRPVLSCLVMLIIVYLFYAFPGMMTRVFPFLKEHYFYRFISVIFSHYVVVLIVIMLLDYGWIYRKGNFLKTLLVGMALIVDASLSCYFSIVGAFRSAADSSFLSFPYILLGIITIIGIGFFEESFFRGVISNIIGKHYAKDRKGVWLSVFISSVFFGLLHMVNMFYGVKLLPAIIQSVVAVFAGMALCATYYRGGSIWAMMFIHSLIDFGPLFGTSFLANPELVDEAAVVNQFGLVNLTPALISLLITLFLLRNSKINEAIDHFK